MRVKLDEEILASKSIRITPAHAGKTEMFGNQFTVDEDHPRACG